MLIPITSFLQSLKYTGIDKHQSYHPLLLANPQIGEDNFNRTHTAGPLGGTALHYMHFNEDRSHAMEKYITVPVHSLQPHAFLPPSPCFLIKCFTEMLRAYFNSNITFIHSLTAYLLLLRVRNGGSLF